MAETKSLSSREVLFCLHYARLGSLFEAAVRAGVPVERAQQTAARLLVREEIQAEIGRYRRALREAAAGAALAGLHRLAFGESNDAVRLALMDEAPDPEELRAMDLYSVAEIKRPKGGGLEMKFFDRLGALKLLAEHSRDSGGERENSFYAALEKGARALGSGSERDEL